MGTTGRLSHTGPSDYPHYGDAIKVTRREKIPQWQAHVQQRRAPVAAARQRGGDERLLRADLNIDSTIELLSGVFYYQFVVRGASLSGLEVQARLTAACNTAWRAILRSDTPG